ncbi:MAG TPA: hypothetical protein VIU15_26175, partial [Streptomyces sp.]
PEHLPLPPAELRDANHLAHAACLAGEQEIAGVLLGLLGRRATPTPWMYTGDPAQQITRYHRDLTKN